MLFKRMLVAVAIPVGLAVLCFTVRDVLQSTDRFAFAAMLSTAIEWLYFWPEKLAAFTGLPLADLAYGRAGAALSVLVQCALFFWLYHPENEEA